VCEPELRIRQLCLFTMAEIASTENMTLLVSMLLICSLSDEQSYKRNIYRNESHKIKHDIIVYKL
jgi:hypothetical protein